MGKNNYIGKTFGYLMLIVGGRIKTYVRAITFLILILPGFQVKAQYSLDKEDETSKLIFDEISVFVMVEGYKNFYTEAIYTSNDSLYFNIADLFTTLNISYTFGDGGNSVTGFVGSMDKPYFIDLNSGLIKVGSKTFDAGNRLVKVKGMLYIESSLLYEAFGLKLVFNYRSLSVVLKSDFELPVIKQLRLEKLRNNMLKIEGEVVPDTVVGRNYHVFKPGIIDWSVASFQTMNGPSNNQFNVGVGAELFFGEADFSVYYNDLYGFDSRQLHYLWRWIDNEKKLIRQVQLGKFSNKTISFINAPIIGGVIRNAPTSLRQAKGYYTITDISEPNWTVELYINDVLVDFTTTDASGLYIFKIPNVYGYTTLKLKFYGPMGEERTEERTMNLPYTVLPEHEFEYSISGGMLQDSSWSRFGRAEFNYGLSSYFTLGGGIEYLSSIPNYPYIPFINATILPISRLTISGEYAHRVKIKGLLNYYFGKNALVELDYTRFTEGQLATRFNALEERKIRISMPYRVKWLAGYSKFNYSQLVYKSFNYNQANAIVTAYYKQFNSNLTTQLNWINDNQIFLNFNLAASYRLKRGYLVRPSCQYNLTENQLATFKVEIEKNISRGYLTFSYQRNAINNENYLNFNFKYDLDFARTNLNVSYNKGNFSFSESAQGSFALGGGKNNIHVSNNSSISKGGILIYPFLDLNQNDIFDSNEYLVKLSSVKVMGGKASFNDKDSIIRVFDLNAFTNYLIDFDDNDLGNISWRFKYKKFKVLIDPNQFKRVDVPVISVGEVSGMAYKNIDSSLIGIGRILVKFYRKDSFDFVAETLSESDGYFYYMGLEPGEYIARIDSTQLGNLNFAVDPQKIEFKINSSKDGDIVENIKFVLETDRFYAQDNQEDEKEVGAAVLKDSANTSTTSGDIESPSPKRNSEKSDPGTTNSEETFIYEGEKYPSWIKIIPIEEKDNLLPETGKNKPAESKSEDYQLSVVIDTAYNVTGDTLYKVQLLATLKPVKINEHFSRLLDVVPGLTILESKKGDGLYRYSTGAFGDNLEARELMKVIRENGWKDCFLAISREKNSNETIFQLKRDIF